MLEASIVIVCMNNLNNIYPCLSSIERYTTISYETFVVAYLFSKENLEKLKIDYPWVIIIESNEIRGFAENNNLALLNAKGKYCFVLNDDTLFDVPLIDLLVESIEKTPDAAIMSPKTLFGSGRTQSCGRPIMNWNTFILGELKLWHEQKVDSIYTNQEGIFQTYNIVGAAFLIKTEVFKKMGWFDEYYFFCPEDIALSTKLNKAGYRCYVNSNSELYHLEGGTAKLIQTATMPASIKGALTFYSEDRIELKIFLTLFIIMSSSIRFIYWSFNRKKTQSAILAKANLNCIKAIFSRKTPKEIFIKFYSQIKK